MATSNKPADVTLTVKAGSDVTLNLTGAYVSTGHTMVFCVHNMSTGALVFDTAVTASQTTPSTIASVAIAEADTAGMSSRGNYRWSVWRTNSGSKTPLAEGPFKVAPTPEVADV